MSRKIRTPAGGKRNRQDMSRSKLGRSFVFKYFRKEAGCSQKDIAEIMEVSQNTVYNWETGRNRPDPDLFPELCNVMGISLNDLFGIKPEEGITTHEKRVLDQ